MTADPRDLELEVIDDAPDTVQVPRRLALEMAQAIEAMQSLASNRMQDVAKGLGLIARRKPPPEDPACEDCGVRAWVGLEHLEDCNSPEALRHRYTEVPQLTEE